MSDTKNGIAPENIVPVEKPLIDPFWKRSVARGDFLSAVMVDLAFAAVATRAVQPISTFWRPARLLRSTPVYNLLASVLAGMTVIGIRELVVSPLLLGVGGRVPELQERRDLYALERKALAFGDRDARELTKELHRVNNQDLLNRVGETGVAGYLASFLIIGSGNKISAREFVRTSPLRLGYGITMMASQMLYNDLTRRVHEPEAHFYHSRTWTSNQLEAEINQHLKAHATLEALHREIAAEQLQDEVIQVQNELSAVRRALALNSSQKLICEP